MADILQEIKKEHDEARELLHQIHTARTKELDYLKELYALLTGHHRAEEAVAFPKVASYDEKGKELIADLRKEHTEAEDKMLELIRTMQKGAPLDLEMLQEIEGDVLHHMTEEEEDLFKKARQAFSKKELEEALPPFEDEEEKAKEKAEKQVGL